MIQTQQTTSGIDPEVEAILARIHNYRYQEWGQTWSPTWDGNEFDGGVIDRLTIPLDFPPDWLTPADRSLWERVCAERLVARAQLDAAYHALGIGSLLTALCCISACEGASSGLRAAFFEDLHDDVEVIARKRFGNSLRRVESAMQDFVGAGQKLADLAQEDLAAFRRVEGCK